MGIFPSEISDTLEFRGSLTLAEDARANVGLYRREGAPAGSGQFPYAGNIEGVVTADWQILVDLDPVGIGDPDPFVAYSLEGRAGVSIGEAPAPGAATAWSIRYSKSSGEVTFTFGGSSRSVRAREFNDTPAVVLAGETFSGVELLGDGETVLNYVGRPALEGDSVDGAGPGWFAADGIDNLAIPGQFHQQQLRPLQPWDAVRFARTWMPGVSAVMEYLPIINGQMQWWLPDGRLTDVGGALIGGLDRGVRVPAPTHGSARSPSVIALPDERLGLMWVEWDADGQALVKWSETRDGGHSVEGAQTVATGFTQAVATLGADGVIAAMLYREGAWHSILGVRQAGDGFPAWSAPVAAVSGGAEWPVPHPTGCLTQLPDWSWAFAFVGTPTNPPSATTATTIELALTSSLAEAGGQWTTTTVLAGKPPLTAEPIADETHWSGVALMADDDGRLLMAAAGETDLLMNGPSSVANPWVDGEGRRWQTWLFHTGTRTGSDWTFELVQPMQGTADRGRITLGRANGRLVIESGSVGRYITRWLNENDGTGFALVYSGVN